MPEPFGRDREEGGEAGSHEGPIFRLAEGLMQSLFLRPTCRRDPGTTFGTYLIRSSRRQHIVGPRSDVGVDLRDLFVVEKFVPGLHSVFGAPVANGPQEFRKSELFVG